MQHNASNPPVTYQCKCQLCTCAREEEPSSHLSILYSSSGRIVGNLESIHVDFRLAAGYPLGRSIMYPRADTGEQPLTHTYEQFKVASSHNLHVFGLFQETRAPGRNPRPSRFKPRNHCTAMPPSQETMMVKTYI